MTLPIVRTHADTVRLFDANGEEVALRDAPTEWIADLRDEIRAAEEDQRIAKQQLDAEIHRRMDLDNTLTLHADGYIITGKAAETDEWDVEQLRLTLEDLVATGELGEDAARRALKTEVVHKPVAGELKKLLAKPATAATIDACRTRVPQTRRATVKRAA